MVTKAKSKNNARGNKYTPGRVRSYLNNVEKFLAGLKEKGVDVSSEKKLIARARMELKAKKCKKSLSTGLKAKKQLQALKVKMDQQKKDDKKLKKDQQKKDDKKLKMDQQNEVKKQGKKHDKNEEKEKRSAIPYPELPEHESLPEGINSMMKQMVDHLNRALDKGLDVSEAEDIYTLAQKEIKLSQFVFLEENLKNGIKIIESVENRYFASGKKELDGEYSTFEEKVADLEKQGGDVTRLHKQLDELKKSIEENRFDDGKRKVQELTEGVKEQISNLIFNEHKNNIDEKGILLAEFEKRTDKKWSDLQGLVESARNSLGSGAFEEVGTILEEFDGVLARSEDKYLQTLTNERLATLDNDIEMVAEFGLDRDKADKLMEKARQDVMEGNIDPANLVADEVTGMVETVRKVKAKEFTTKLLKEVNKLKIEIKKNKIPMGKKELSQVRDAEKKAKGLDSKKKYVAAYRQGVVAKEILIKFRRNYYSEITENKLSVMAEFVDTLSAHDFIGESEVAQHRAALEDCQALFDKGEMFKAHESCLELEKELDILGERINRFKTSGKLMEELAELKAQAFAVEFDISDFQNQMNKAETLFKKADYSGVIPIVEKCLDGLGKGLAEFKCARAEARLEEMAKIFESSKDVLDEDHFEKEMGQIKILMEKGSHDECFRLTEKLIQEMKNNVASKTASRIEGIFDSCEVLLEDNEKMGIDVIKEEALLFRARRSFRKGDVLAAREYVDVAKEEILQARNKYFESKAEAKMDDFLQRELEIKKFKVALSLFGESNGRAKELVSNGRAEEAHEFLISSEKTIEIEIEKSLLAQLKESEAVLEELLKKAEDEGMDSKNGRQRQKKYMEMRDNGDLELALLLIGEIHKEVEEARTLNLKELSKARVENLKRTLEDFEKKVGGEQLKLREQLALAVKCCENDDFSGELSATKVFFNILDELSSSFLREGYTEELGEFEKNLEPMRKLGISLSSFDEGLKALKEFIDKGEFEDYRNGFDALKGEFETLKNVRVKKQVQGYVAEVKERLDLGETRGLKLEAIRKIMVKVVASIKKQDFVSAHLEVKKALGDLDKVENKFYRKKSLESLNRCNKLLDKAMGLKVSVAQIIRKLADAKDLYDAGEFSKAYKFGELIVSELEASIDKTNVSNADTLIQSVKKLKTLVSGLGINVDVINDLLSNVKEYKRSGEYGRVRDVMREAQSKIVADLDEWHTRVIHKQKAKLERLRAWTGNPMEGLNSHLEDISRYFTNGKYENMIASRARFVEKYSEQKRAHKVKKYSDDLEEVRAEILSLKSAGFDVIEIAELVEIAGDYMARGDFDNYRMVFSDITELLVKEKETTVKTFVQNLDRQVQELYSELLSSNMRLDKERELMDSYLKLMEQKKYIEVCQHANDVFERLKVAKRELFIEKTNYSMKKARSLLQETRKLGLDVELIEEMLKKSARLFKEDKFEAAKKFSDKGNKFLFDLIESKRMKDINLEYLEFENLLDRATETGVNIDEGWMDLVRFNKLRKSKQFSGLKKEVREAREKTKLIVKKKLISELDEARSKLSELESLSGEKYSDISSGIKDIEKAVNDGDYVTFGKLLKSFTDAQKARRNEYLTQKNMAVLEELERGFQVFEALGMEISWPRKLLDNGRSFIDNNMHEKFTKLHEKLNGILEDTRTTRSKEYVTSLIKELKAEFVELKEVGADVVELKNKFVMAVKLTKKGDFIPAIKSIKEVLGEIPGVREKHEASVVMDRCAELLEEAGVLGLETGEWISKLETVNLDFENGNFKNSVEVGSGLNVVLEKMVEKKHQEDVDLELKGLNNILGEVGDIPLDLVKAKEVIADVDRMRESGEYRGLLLTLQNAQAGLVEKANAYLLPKFETARTMLSDLEADTRQEYQALRDMMAEAERSLEEGHFSACKELLLNLSGYSTEERKNYFTLEHGKLLVELEKGISELESLDIDVTDSAKLLAEARGHIDAHEHESFGEVYDRLIEFLNDAKTNKAKKMSMELIEILKQELAGLKELGGDLGELKADFITSIKLVREGKYIEGTSALKKQKEMLPEIKQKLKSALANQLIEDIKQLMARAINLRLDVTQAIDVLSRSRGLLESQNYDEVIDIARKVKGELNPQIQSELSGDLETKQNEYGTLIALGEEMGLDIYREKKIMDGIIQYIEDGDVVRALDIIDESIISIGARLRLKLDGKLDRARKEVEGLEKEIDQPLPDLTATLKELSLTLDKGIFTEILSSLEVLYNDMEGRKNSYLVKKYLEDLVIISDEVKSLGNLGMEVDELEGIVEATRKSALQMEFDAYKEGLVSINMQMEQTRSVKARDMVKAQVVEIKATFLKMSKLGLELKVEKDMFRELVKNIKSGKYIDGIRQCHVLTEQLAQKELDHNIDLLSKKLLQARQKLERARKLGLEMEGVARALNDAEEELEKEELGKEELGKVRELIDGSLLELDEAVGARYDSMISDKIALLDKDLVVARDVGAIVKPIDDGKLSLADLAEQKKYEQQLVMVDDLHEKLRIIIKTWMEKGKTEVMEKYQRLTTEMSRTPSSLKRSKNEVILCFEQNDAAKMSSMIDDFDVKFLEIQDEFLLEKYAPVLAEFIESASKIVELGIDIGTFVTDLKKAEMALVQKQYVDVEKMVSVLKTDLNDIKKNRVATVAESHITAVEVIKGKLIDENVKIKIEMNMLEKAKKALVEERYIVALNIARETRSKFESLEKGRELERVNEEIDAVAGMFGEAEDIGLETSSLEEMLEMSRTLAQKDEFEKARKLSAEAKKFLRSKINGKLEELFQVEMSRLDALREEATGNGMDFGEIESGVEEVRGLHADLEFSRAIDVARNLTHKARKNIDLHMRSLVVSRIQGARNEYSRYTKRYGSQFPELEQFINEAEKSLQQEDFVAIDTYMEKFNNGKLRLEINNVEDAITELKELGLDVPMELDEKLQILKKEGGFVDE